MDTSFQTQYQQEANELASHSTNILLDPPDNDSTRQSFERVDLMDDNRCFLLYNLLSPKECFYFINACETIGLEELGSSVSKGYRNHTRCIVMGPNISEWLWDRLKPLIEEITLLNDDYKQIGLGHKLEGHWKPIGLNPCWRMTKYIPEGHFGPHFDGPFIKDANNRSLKTLNIYLNGDFEGGTTNLVKENQMLYKDKTTGIYKAQEENILYKIKPEEGMALIFNHHILHEGEALQTNHKYLLRSDIMYTREEPPQLLEHEQKALEMLTEAERCEDNHEISQAVIFYKRAYKLWPELEHQHQ
jgi:hypothetical protein